MKHVWVLGLALGCGSVEGKTPDAKVSDASSIDSPADAEGPRCDPSKSFGVPDKLKNVNSSMDDMTPFITANELELSDDHDGIIDLPEGSSGFGLTRLSMSGRCRSAGRTPKSRSSSSSEP